MKLGKLTVALVSAIGLTAQPAGPKFEVASVKASTPGTMPPVRVKIDDSQMTLGSATMKQLLVRAFRLRPYQLSGPEWWDTAHFDIMARIPAGATKEQVPEMLQGLLADRFGLVAHTESKDFPGIALTVAKGGPKLEAAPAENPKGAPKDDGGPVSTRDADGSIHTVANGPNGKTVLTDSREGQHLEMERMSMARLAELLTVRMGVPVLDTTGLTGEYRIVLDIARSDMAGARQPAQDPAAGAADPGNSVFSSIQKLGLKLDRQKVPVPMLVVERLERTPKEN
jgi:uncharacterized protein (TIGR03435 family)